MHLIIPIGFSSGILFSSQHVKHVLTLLTFTCVLMEDVLAQAVTINEHSSAYGRRRAAALPLPLIPAPLEATVVAELTVPRAAGGQLHGQPCAVLQPR